ncbi:phage antirepressor Ant [Photobacterium kishitanii]|uniref:phage antirepressor KilAC domain-containing protein n=1 Tax=Photobacterium kishitanii TaxID=318456 RepID=UPI000D17D5A9|nr:phage antirepressor KilAC domain-containing protein [Photobacterium kishitanii]PSU88978.1 phage antirepressor Ant [Photobacterium kishitanii]
MKISVMQNHELNMSSLDFLTDYINPARIAANESEVRNNDFNKKIIDECDDLVTYEKIVRGNTVKYFELTYDQMMLVGMCESKAVRKNLLAKLRELQLPNFIFPASFADALQLAADQAKQIEYQNKHLMLSAPKVDFAERLTKVGYGVTLDEFSYSVHLDPSEIFTVLREMKILIRSRQSYNLPMQRYIESGYFVVRQTINERESDSIACIPLLTRKGELWLTHKLIKAGVLKAVAV